MSRVAEGTERQIRPGRGTYPRVIARCEDGDTPLIALEFDDGRRWLTDVQTKELIDRLRRALNVLPASK